MDGCSGLSNRCRLQVHKVLVRAIAAGQPYLGTSCDVPPQGSRRRFLRLGTDTGSSLCALLGGGFLPRLFDEGWSWIAAIAFDASKVAVAFVVHEHVLMLGARRLHWGVRDRRRPPLRQGRDRPHWAHQQVRGYLSQVRPQACADRAVDQQPSALASVRVCRAHDFPGDHGPRGGS